MKRAPLVSLICFLFVGPTPPEEEWTILLLDGSGYSSVSLVRLEGDNLVAIDGGDTCLIPVGSISEIFTSWHPLGVPGWLIGFATGAVAGAGCAYATAPHGPVVKDEEKFSLFCAQLGGLVGCLGGCLAIPDEEVRYDLGDKPLLEKRAIISSILAADSVRQHWDAPQRVLRGQQ